MGGRNANDEAPIITDNGIISISNGMTSNASENVTISNVAPAGVETATISKWLIIKQTGTTYYIPCWT